MPTHWLGLNTTRTIKIKVGNHIDEENVPVTDKYAKKYAAEKFGVPISQIELQRTGGCILVRPVEPDEESFEFMTRTEFLESKYGVPEEGDPYYDKFKEFGYYVYLMNVHPEVYKQPGVTWDEIMQLEELGYHWYCIDVVYGNGKEVTENALESVLRGQPRVTLHSSNRPFSALDLPRNALGVALWEVGDRQFCLFLNTDGELTPVMCDASMIENAGGRFDSWSDLEV